MSQYVNKCKRKIMKTHVVVTIKKKEREKKIKIEKQNCI